MNTGLQLTATSSAFRVASGQVQQLVHELSAEGLPVLLADVVQQRVRRLVVHVLYAGQRGVVILPADDPEAVGRHLDAVVCALQRGEVDVDALVVVVELRGYGRNLHVLADVIDGCLGFLWPGFLV